MAVKVTTKQKQSPGTTEITAKHEDAGSVNVHDGHLQLRTVSGPNGDTVAIYAPGAWQAAEVLPKSG